MIAYCVSGMAFRTEPFEIHGTQIEMCKAHLDTWPVLTHTEIHPRRVPRVVVNAAFVNPIVRLGADWLATDDAVAAIRAVASVKVRPVKIVDAFHYPVDPADESYLKDSVYVHERSLPSKNVRAFAKKYRCPVPRYRLWLLEFRDIDHLKPKPRDVVVLHVKRHSASITDKECPMSPSALDRHGILWSRGHWCSPKAWKVVKDWIHPYVFYWCRRRIRPERARRNEK